jgi:beta-lactamase class A
VLLALACSASDFPGSSSYPKLEESGDAEFQQVLEAALASKPGFMESITSKKLALVVVDVTDLRRPRLAEFNSRQMMYAASITKLGIVFAAGLLIDRGELELDDALRTSLEKIVRKSSNAEAARVFDLIGGERIAELLESEPYRLYDPELGGGLWVGKSYDKTPAWKRDPIAGLSHGANALQVARLYYLVVSGQAFSPETSANMREIFGRPELKHKFVKGLEGKPAQVTYRKSGTWKAFHADSGVIERTGDVYIIVALAEDPRGEEKLQKLVRIVDDMMDERHDASASGG